MVQKNNLKEKAQSLGIEVKDKDTNKDIQEKIDNLVKSDEDKTVETITVDKNNNKVIVYCKIPNGLVFTIGKRELHINGLPITHTYARTAGRQIPTQYRIDYGKTYNVSKDDFEYIKKVYGEEKFFKKGLIFAVDDVKVGDDKAQEQKDIKTGFETIDTKSTRTQEVK